MRYGPATTIITLVLLAVFGVVLITPIVTVVQAGFVVDGSASLGWFQDVLANRLYREGLLNSLLIAVFTTALTLVIAIPLALLANAYDFPGKRLWLALIQVPLVLPPFVGAIGMQGMLSRNGGVNELLVNWGWIEPTQAIDWTQNRFLSVVVLMALYLYPITFLNVQAALANIDPALDEAGRNLGAGSWRRFFRITLPLMRPGVFAGGTIVFIWAFTELGTPLMVGFKRVAAVQVYDSLEDLTPSGDAYALVVVLLASSVVLYLIGKLVLGRPLGGMMAKATVAAETKKLGAVGALLVTLPFALVFFIAALPHLGVLLYSLSGTGMLEFSPDDWTATHHAQLAREVFGVGGYDPGVAGQSIINSFKYAAVATAVALVFGFAVAYLVVRRRSWLTGLLDHLAMLPLAVPGLVMAFGYFAMTQPSSPFSVVFGALNPIEHDPTILLVIAYATRRLPFIVRSCAAGLEQTSEALEESAINLGAGPLRTMMRIVVPLLAANFIAGGLLVFSRSMLEVSDSLILAFDEPTYPMTKAILKISERPEAGLEMASALGVWGMGILTLTIVGASLALGKRLGALFRV